MKKLFITLSFLILIILGSVINAIGANRYWVGGTDSWDATPGLKWSTISGGTGGAAVPTSTDDVFFDLNSGSVTVTRGAGACCNNLDFTGFTGSMIGTDGMVNYGNLILGSGMTGFNGLCAWAHTSGTRTITSNGITINGYISKQSNSGTLQLYDDINITSYVELKEGTFDANNKNITCSNFISQYPNVRILNMGSGTWTLTGDDGMGSVWDCITTTNLTINCNTSTIKLTNGTTVAKTFHGGGKIYNNFWNAVTSGVCIIDESNTFNDFKVDAGNNVVFEPNSTQTISSLTAIGNPSHNILLGSDGGVSHFTFIKSSGVVNCYFLDLIDSWATGGATWNATCSTDGGGNTGWVFQTTSAPTAGNNGPVCLGSLLTLSASIIAGATYSWTGPDGFTSSVQNPTVSNNATAAMAGTYSVTATVGGCTSPAGTTTVNISNGQSFVWAKDLGGSSGDVGQFITRDSSGNIYTTGYFHGTADFDPGAGTSNLISAGGVDIFISKLDPSGSYIWAKKFGGTGNDYGFSDAVDAFGNVYSTGQFQGTVDFDPNAGTYNLTSVGSSGTYISKLDASGNFKWAKQMSGTSDNEGISITTDASGNVYTTGVFKGTTDFDPNAGTYNLSSAGSFDVFISKLDSSGNFIWAKKIGGTLSDHGYSIKVGASGNIYITGRFQNTVDFDPGAGTYNLTSAGAGDVFILKLNSNGGFIWAKQFSGVLDDYAYSNAIDNKENVYTTGYFNGTVDFDPGAGTYNLTSAGNKDIFVSKLDSAGSFIWAKKMGGTADESGWSIAVDDSHNVYTTGYFAGTADFDPGPSTNNFTCAGVQDVFISKLDSMGNFVWAKQIGGNGNDIGRCIDLDASGNIYITGDFQGTVDFDPEAGTYNLSSAGSDDIFVAKYHQPDFMQIVITPHNANCNQANGWAQATVNGGTLPYHYLWSNGDTTAIADTLVGGSYSLLVTDGCGNSKLVYFTINNSGGFTISGTTQDVHCSGGNDGAIDLTIIGGTGPFNVHWSNGATTQDISGLVAGTYDVNVSDAVGCVGFASYNILDGANITFSNINNDPGCGLTNGSIAITPSGGATPYTYNWSSGQTTATISGVGAGNYIVTITDGNSCITVGQISLSSGGAPVITIDSVTSAPCGGSGAAYITVTGGALPLTYHWSNSFTVEDLVGVVPGNYTVTVIDNGSCIAVAQVTIPTDLLPVQPICMVTVDSLISRNKIVWSKVSSSGVDYYKIYRESSTPGQYLFVDTVRNTSMSKFTDMAANPMTRSWRYKISQVDLCGNESTLSDLHKTMHLTINHGMGNQFNLIWDDYEGYYYPMFYVLRHTNALGWKTLDSLPNTLHSYTDDPPSLGGLKYVVAIKKADSCIVGINKDQTETYNTSVSNMEEYQILGIAEFKPDLFDLSAYPNPFTNSINISYSLRERTKVNIEIYNVLQEKVASIVNTSQAPGNYKFEFKNGGNKLATGVYYIRAMFGDSGVIRKVIKL